MLVIGFLSPGSPESDALRLTAFWQGGRAAQLRHDGGTVEKRFSLIGARR
jgi:hypothetical protein